MLEIDLVRNNPHIDPNLHIWGWEVPVYLFLGGLTAGVMILSAVLSHKASQEDGPSRAVRLMPFLAVVLISLGMLALWLDLESKLRAYRFYLSFQFMSPMSWGAWILLLVYPATLGLGLSLLTEKDLAWLTRLSGKLRLSSLFGWLHRLAVRHKGLLIKANLLLGAGLGVYTGVLLGTLGARAAWNSALLGPLFLVSGLSTGAAVLMLMPVSEKEHHRLLRWDLAAIGVELTLLFLYLVHLLSGGGQEGLAAAMLFFGGKYTAHFWSLVIIAGLLVPLILESMEFKFRLRATALAPALLLIGGLSLRWILVAAGQA